jgi:hypothetical protein
MKAPMLIEWVRKKLKTMKADDKAGVGSFT